MTPSLRPGTPGEARLLSDLALRSKAHWGYDAAFLAACRDDLTLGAGAAERSVVAEADGRVAGFHLLLAEDSEARVGRLEMLFVDPAALGGGVGRLLVQDAVSRAAARGWRTLRLDADPHAEAFYLRLGARRVGEVPSTAVPGRVLPLLELDVAAGSVALREQVVEDVDQPAP
ncbi:acetyltransferase (GNAT) family protein [Lapillicoccus jejuensis]|uniref:Acetyltransferase (GNAT) family protein n=1 Tax=Lapillicoccus jejuensis TaxID=402171 RepID=A0A542E379_9MICO|nr:acetyltransferase (GNAT) family protein [Lapillicoccus jejuensis]